MRSYCRALPGDRIGGARDRGGKADAVFGVVDIVVHGLRNRNHLHAHGVQFGGIAECVVSADRDQRSEPQRLRCFSRTCELTSYTIDVLPPLVTSFLRKILVLEEIGKLRHRHLGGIGPAAVQDRAAVTVDGAGILARQRQDVARFAWLIVQADVGQPFPSAPNANHFTAVLGRSVSDFLDD